MFVTEKTEKVHHLTFVLDQLGIESTPRQCVFVRGWICRNLSFLRKDNPAGRQKQKRCVWRCFWWSLCVIDNEKPWINFPAFLWSVEQRAINLACVHCRFKRLCIFMQAAWGRRSANSFFSEIAIHWCPRMCTNYLHESVGALPFYVSKESLNWNGCL